MSNKTNPVWITGIGLLSSLGEGVDTHWDAMNAGKPQNIEAEKFVPYAVHALGEVDWSKQISRRDMRQMEPWQRIGTYAAGLALDDAGAKDDEDLLGRMDMIVSAGGGERDIEVDSAIMADARTSQDRASLLTERLSNDLRPTLFLAQLSNLLAGNISIVHKVTGSSRTFMGEEGAGISAIRTAHARIASGQSDIVLVGGACNGEREDMLLLFELGGYCATGEPKSVWSRKGDSAGFNLGSAGAFLVLESKEHAEKRGAKCYSELAAVVADHGKRDGGAPRARLDSLLQQIGLTDSTAILSGATGAAEATELESQWLADNTSNNPVRAWASVIGNSVEAHFPFGIALAAMAAKRGEFYAPFDGIEKAADKSADQIIVTTIGHHRGEGIGLVKPVQA